MIHHVYIAELTDGRFYVGMTHLDPEIRKERHQAGAGSKYVRSNPVLRVVRKEAFTSARTARLREIQLKRWSHAKKQALVDGDVARLQALARSRHSQ